MRFSHFFIDRPIFAAVISLIIPIVGGIAYLTLPDHSQSIDDGSVGPRIVTLGPMVDGLRVIRTGLKATDKIVIKGLQRIRPGQMVTTELGTIETSPAQN